MSKHTPGPWTADEGNGEFFGVFAESNAEEIAYLCKPDQKMRPLPEDGSDVAACELAYARRDEHVANAHLMAAAPDLLVAANAARAELFRLGQRHDNSPVMQALYAAISKAER